MHLWPRNKLAYGKWTSADGRQVLFNRDYKPIWHRLPDGRVEPTDPEEWVPHVKEEWFHDDSASMGQRIRITREQLAGWGLET
jgi:hypothetical protein